MIQKRLLGALTALSAVIAACGSATIDGAPGDSSGGSGPTAGTPGVSTGGIGNGTGTGGTGTGPGTGGTGTGPGTGGTGTGPGAGGSGNPQTGGTGTVGTGGTPADPVGACKPGLPSATQIPKLRNRQYANAVKDLLGITKIDNQPVADVMYADFTGAMTNTAWDSYKSVAAKIAAAVVADATAKGKFISCDPTVAGCIKTTVEAFGRKAFRRPLRADEVTKFEAFGNTTPKGTANEITAALIEAFLVSPSFLLMPEVGKIGTDGNAVAETATATDGTPALKLTSNEVATKLSFLLWGSIPDDALTMAASSDQLQTAAQIKAQADRLLKDPRSGEMLSAFHSEWARINDSGAHWYEGRDHDPAKFPGYKPEAKESYKAEMNAFFADVALSGGSFQDLFTSKVGFVNKDNAYIYGLDPAGYGTDLTKVTLQDRPGFLTRAGFLSSYSNYGASSPILRGAYIGIWILSLPIGAPDPSFAMTTVNGTFATQRAYVEALTEKSPACMGCHQSVNPPGYIFEKFDAIGKVQTKDPLGGAIDATITTANVTLGTKPDGTLDTRPMSSPEQLMAAVAEMAAPGNRYAKVLVEFGYDRDNNQFDQCVVDQLSAKIKAGAYPILSLAADLTQADSFRLRAVVQ